MDIKELQSKFLDIDSTIGELQKAFDDMQTAEHAGVVMPVEYDPEIKKRIIEQTPFTEFLRSQGCIAPTDKVKVGYKEKTNKTTSNWMYENDEIAKATPSDFNEKIATMKIIHYPISIGDLAQKAGEYDIFADEMNDGYIDIANNVDYTLLEGKAENKDFKGVFNLINTNTINLGGDLLTKDDLTSAFQGIIDEGGYPTGIVCTSEVADQINDIYFPGTVKQLEYELVAGYNVVGIITTAGNRIPVIVDRYIDNSSSEKLAILDSSSIKVKELIPLTVVPWAKTRLANDQSIIQALTMYMDAEFKNAQIKGIGKDENRPGLTRTGDVAVRVLGTDAKPVKGAKLSFTDESENVFKSSLTNANGQAEVPQLTYGTYEVAWDTVPDGYTQTTLADYTVQASRSDLQLILTKN